MPAWSKQFFRILRSALIRFSSPFSLCPECEFGFEKLEKRFGIEKTVNFPIDLVYTWVNGEQNEHTLKRYLHLSDPEKFHRDGVIKGRFADNQELKYSLRSVEEYLPWVNRIFIVTDNQRPPWIVSGNKKIHFVPHQAIIPQAYLPTFNSHVIEAYLHTIPALSEHYIYLNDDFFLTRPCSQQAFFTHNGLPLIFTDWRKTRLNRYLELYSPHARSFFNTLNVFKQAGLSPHAFITAHGPYAQTKTNALAAAQFFQVIVSEFSRNKFRTDNEVAFYSHAIPMLSIYKKTAIPCDVEYYYMNIKRFDRGIFYKSLLKNKQKKCTTPLFLCINDTTTSDSVLDTKAKHDMEEFLQKFYPEKNIFEL